MASLEQFEREWDVLCDLLDEFASLRRDQRFSPSIAQAFAQALALATSLDEARECMRRDPEAAAHFSVAAHFAVGFVRVGTPAILAKDATQREPFLLVASAVLNLLDALSDKYPL